MRTKTQNPKPKEYPGESDGSAGEIEALLEDLLVLLGINGYVLFQRMVRDRRVVDLDGFFVERRRCSSRRRERLRWGVLGDRSLLKESLKSPFGGASIHLLVVVVVIVR